MVTNRPDHVEVVRQQFSGQATRFEQHMLNLRNNEQMMWIVENLKLRAGDVVLDVAAGTGLVARALAPQVQKVVALDATPAMLEQGRRLSQQEGLTNIVFKEGTAEHLPYPDDSFDIVTCRLGIHHFQQPEVQAKEMVRVCRPGGQVVVIDIASAEDEEVAALHNRLERVRDPSHTRALSPVELRHLAEGCGLGIVRSTMIDLIQNLRSWMEVTGTGVAERRFILGKLSEELNEGPPTGMRPFREDGEIMFCHSLVILVGVKKS